MDVISHNLGRYEDHDSVDPASLVTDAAPVAESSADQVGPADESKPRSRKRVRRALRKFFRPAQGSPRWRRVLPWATVLVILVGLVIGSAHAWAWSNSPAFCGTTCHTMPPQFATYELSPHSRVSCVECHIGRDFIGKQLPRKAVHTQFIFRMAFGLYEYPIYVKGMRPARDACETCHSPAKFSNDSLIVKQHYAPDETNTPSSVYLVMHIGGGTQRQGLGYGIHWHVENTVQFVSTDPLDQNIPYIRVTKNDGTVTEYTDISANFDPSAVKQSDLKTMDCITCHNRVSHTIPYPDQSIENSMARGVISVDIPFIRREAQKALTKGYANEGVAFEGIANALDTFYKTSYPDFYVTETDKLQAAIAEVQRIYSVSVFSDQLLDWNTHPDNLGHINSPGCFRCHDGKHLDAAKKAIRLECNLCHSVPVVAGPDKLVTNLEVDRGPEPPSHLNANWISLHNQVYLTDKSCVNCHTMADDGGTSNISFCSNSACHGTLYKYAGFDAPALRDNLQGQLPTPTTVAPPPSASGIPTYNSVVGPIFAAKCGACHGSNPSAGLSLTAYASAIRGGVDGPAMIPGDSANSLLVKIQSTQHFANLSAQELQTVKQWIDAGAPLN
jgi:nitrate/TMAO reductase-like tetraheme cytochrome c subunit